MVALLSDSTAPALGHRPNAPSLRLVHSRPTSPRPLPIPAVLAVVAVALVLVVGVLRLAQGAPPATTWTELGRSSVAVGAGVAGEGDVVVRVHPGESLWSIASKLAPGQDRRPIVDTLARANGGTVLQAGQELVIPAALVRR